MSRTLGCVSNAFDRVGARVHRVHRSGEATGEQVSQYGVTDRVGSAARSDHGDGARRQQLGDRACLGGVFTLGMRVEPVLGPREVEGDFNDARFRYRDQVTSNPASRNTLRMGWFRAITCATK